MANGNVILKQSADSSKYTPTSFEIYDKSTTTKCNRLICIKPFDWIVWAINNEIYVINPESGFNCPINSTPAVLVTSKTFTHICLKIHIVDLLKNYKETGVKKTVPFDITGTKFTIITALNILLKNWVTLEDSNLENYMSFTPNIETEKLERLFAPAPFVDVRKLYNNMK